MARPGIVIYFDTMGPLKLLPDADKGRLFWAMLEYGKDGIVPQFDGTLALAWEFVKPKLDRDDENYENSCNQRAYAAFCKNRWRLKLPKISFEEWASMDSEERKLAVDPDNEAQREQRTVDFVASRYPTTPAPTSTATPTPISISTPVSTAAVAATNTNSIYTEDGGDGSERRVKVLGGELGKSVVFLSDEQFDDLLDRMDLETFNYYVDKLSNFIIKNDAHVKNHYETLLKWWKEDSIVHSPRKKEEIPKGASGKLGEAEMESIRRLMAEDG